MNPHPPPVHQEPRDNLCVGRTARLHVFARTRLRKRPHLSDHLVRSPTGGWRSRCSRSPFQRTQLVRSTPSNGKSRRFCGLAPDQQLAAPTEPRRRQPRVWHHIGAPRSLPERSRPARPLLMGLSASQTKTGRTTWRGEEREEEGKGGRKGRREREEGKGGWRQRAGFYQDLTGTT